MTKKFIVITLLFKFLLSANFAYSQNNAEYPTMRNILYRGYINCGLDITNSAFASSPDGGKTWQGFDVDICQALSIAVFGFTNRIRIIPVQIVRLIIFRIVYCFVNV